MAARPEKPILMLSELLRCQVTDDHGRTASLTDLVLDIPASPYPPVQTLILGGNGREKRRLGWEGVRSLDPHRRQIVVGDLAQAVPADPSWLGGEVLIRRDILDALMLDLQARTPILANDLSLALDGLELTLRAVDVSLWAVLRRLSAGRIFGRPSRHLRDWRFIEFLRGQPEAVRQGLDYHGLIARLPPGEIAYLADSLPYLYAAELLTFLPDALSSDTLEMMAPELQVQAFEELDEDKAGRLLALIRPDISADLLARLPAERAEYWLDRLPDLQAERVTALMRFPEDSAGGLMTNDMVAIPKDTTVEQALKTLRQELRQPEYYNFIQIVYVVDDPQAQRLLGALSMRDLLIADEKDRLEKVMNPYLISLDPEEKARAAARRVVESGLVALPVVDDGRLLGVVTIDSALGLTTVKQVAQKPLRLFS